MVNSPLHAHPVLVVGLGRFGASVASSLHTLGHEVLAVDTDPELVQEWSTRLTHVVEADATKPDVIAEIGGGDFPMAVVGIGNSIEASVLATANLADAGVQRIWTKAISLEHGRILERIGAHHVVYPERDAGRRVAHLLNGRFEDFMEVDNDFAVVRMSPPKDMVGKSLTESDVRQRFGVTVVGLKRQGEQFTYADASTVIGQADDLLVSGRVDSLERLAALP